MPRGEFKQCAAKADLDIIRVRTEAQDPAH
jgi:hypothetical protein